MMDRKVLVFDLDGTLSPQGKGMTADNMERLRELERQGYRICICSGKTVFYLCGYVRQIDLEEPILLGENGSVLQFGIDLPPAYYEVLPYAEKHKEMLQKVKQDLHALLPGMWYQPNDVILTPFPRTPEEYRIVSSYLDDHAEELEEISVYRHSDCFDLVPAGIDKKKGLEHLAEVLDLKHEQFVCIGDGVNDYPMFAFAGLSIGIHLAHPEMVDVNAAGIDECLTDLLNGKL